MLLLCNFFHNYNSRNVFLFHTFIRLSYIFFSTTSFLLSSHLITSLRIRSRTLFYTSTNMVQFTSSQLQTFFINCLKEKTASMLLPGMKSNFVFVLSHIIVLQNCVAAYGTVIWFPTSLG